MSSKMNNKLIKKKVILVESNPGIAASFRAWVNELFLETDISVVPSFEEFFVETKKIQPDFIIADINLPGINGPQAIQKMKENGINANVIILANLSEFNTYNQNSFKLGKYNEFVKLPPSLKFGLKNT
jgi:DNA-binding response OmpR family regulator